jgi:hypothetical protein
MWFAIGFGRSEVREKSAFMASGYHFVHFACTYTQYWEEHSTIDINTNRSIHQGHNLDLADRVFPLIISDHDILTSHLVVYPASLLRNEAHESPVEDARSGKGINVANGEEMLSAQAHNRLRIFLLRDGDVVNEARKRRRKPDDHSGDRSPVGRVFGGVAVDAVEVVHVRHRDVAATCDVVVCDQDRCHRS